MSQWKVELSNDEIFVEGLNIEAIKGEKSPWLKLIDYINKYNLKIVSLSLVNNEKNYRLPDGLNDPKFRAFAENEKPTGYNFFRMLGSDLDSAEKDYFSVIEAIYPEHRLQLWVDESSKDCWCIIK